MGDVFAQSLPQRRAFGPTRQVDRRVAGRDHAGRKRGGINEAARAIGEPVDQHARTRDVTADAAERLAQRAHDDFHARAQSSLGERPAPVAP